ncbi:hypothetical protein LQ938_09050 [Microbacterium sp. cx-55]|uniref:hypothetical protein n=1 Tax=Microbacterium sp. cx-55 TaxID=2875948 RepID=UPI001CBE37A1|nr:hypothetical protein [Microbacterium sp. cx-55]MBZ4486090.1 hypothetical protein [Microbacterium sp. cx-55]UGB34039.1 hypothetical protein LQ938_09050 [Microbacterium sp. cx-55]
MSSRADRAGRVFRGSIAALLATLVATVSHSAATAHPPSLLGIVLGLGIAAPLCVLLAGRTHSWWRLSIAVGASQAMFHSLLALQLGEGIGTASSASSLAHAHHVSGSAAGVIIDGAATSHTAESPWMWVAHAIAAVITVLALGLGERAVRLLAALVSRAFRALIPGRAMHPAPVLPVARREPAVLFGLALLSVMRRRGPPVTA